MSYEARIARSFHRGFWAEVWLVEAGVERLVDTTMPTATRRETVEAADEIAQAHRRGIDLCRVALLDGVLEAVWL